MEIRLQIYVLFSFTLFTVESVNILNASVTSQSFTSPNYPSKYPSNSDVYWIISTSTLDSSAGSWVINLEFEDFVTEDHSSCAYDHLEIFDGGSELASSFGRLCGRQTALIYSSSGPSLYVHFYSDYSINSVGFSIIYWATYTAYAIVTQPPPPDPLKRTHDNTSKIIGGVLGGVAGLSIIGLIIYCVYRRKYKKKERPTRLVKKSFKITPTGKMRSVYKTSLKTPDRDDEDNKWNCYHSPSVSEVSDIGPSTSKKPTVAKRAPTESYLFWGRQVPSPFKYLEPCYPADYGCTPY